MAMDFVRSRSRMAFDSNSFFFQAEKNIIVKWFRFRKYEKKNVEVRYYDIVTFIGRCRGSYFRRCVNEKSIPKMRYEERIEPKKTHEQKCCTGYTLANSSFCVPVCEPACEFGTCTAPNTCTCQEGYTKHQTEPNM